MAEASGGGIDPVKLVEGYLGRSTWKSRENSNLGYSFSSVFLQTAGEVMEQYTLGRVYSPEVAKSPCQRGLPHTQPEHGDNRLLRRLEHRGRTDARVQRRSRQDRVLSPEAPLNGAPPARQLHGDDAERVGRSPELQQPRHLPRPLRQRGRLGLQAW